MVPKGELSVGFPNFFVRGIFLQTENFVRVDLRGRLWRGIVHSEKLPYMSLGLLNPNDVEVQMWAKMKLGCIGLKGTRFRYRIRVD